MEGRQAGVESGLPKQAAHLVGQFIKAAAARRDRELLQALAQHQFICLQAAANDKDRVHQGYLPKQVPDSRRISNKTALTLTLSRPTGEGTGRRVSRPFPSGWIRRPSDEDSPSPTRRAASQMPDSRQRRTSRQVGW